jgi:tryptophan synthase alpha chain
VNNKTRLDVCLADKNRTMLSPYLTAGFPSKKLTVPLLHKMVEGGADIIELGIPFSDPMAEGIVIQKAMEKALSNGVTLNDVFNMVSEFRKTDQTTPIILMGYLNTIEVSGYEKFAIRAREAGVDGTIVVDLPPEESEQAIKIWKDQGLDMIFLCSPTTTNERLKMISKHAGAYVYYVSLKGVTGSANIDVKNVKEQYLIKKEKLNRPLLVGFGIKTPETAKALSDFADGVIIGAAFLEAMSAGKEEACLDNACQFLTTIRTAMNQKTLS